LPYVQDLSFIEKRREVFLRKFMPEKAFKNT
jgi:hypothetical protein